MTLRKMSASEERKSRIAIAFCERTRRVLRIRAIVFVVAVVGDDVAISRTDGP